VFGAVDCRVMKGTPSQVKDYVTKSGRGSFFFNEPYWNKGVVNTQAVVGIDWDYVYSKLAGYPSYKRFFCAYCMPHSPLYDS
jgi:hypothetical protein